MNKSFDFCNKCRIDDNSALVHCAVCSYPFHVKCVAPKLTVKACDELVANPSFHFYCEDHRNLCVHKLLNRISMLERKFRSCIEPLSDISNELDKHQTELNNAGYIITEKPATKEAAVATSPSHEIKSIEVLSSQRDEKRGSFASNITLRNSNTKRTYSQVINQEAPMRQNELSDSNPKHSDGNATTEMSSPLSIDTAAPLINRRTEPPNLVCVAPKKAVFLSGFDPTTTIEDILDYIKFYVKPEPNLNIRKMKFNEQSRSAVFVIYVGYDENIFNILCDNSFWPRYANCREYDFFRNRQQSQPRKKLLV